MKVEFQPAFVLHSRPFKDSSLILDCFSRDFGRISLVAKGARGAKAKQKPYCQPFQPLLLSWQGRTDLKTLIATELADSRFFQLAEDYLYCGLYLNELLIRLLPPGDPSPSAFQRYAETIERLVQKAPLESALRAFEFGLLDDLGYGITFTHEAESGGDIQPDLFYRWLSQHGWVPVYGSLPGTVQGCYLLSIAQERWEDPEVRRVAKQLSRYLLAPLLGDKPLNSRLLFENRRFEKQGEEKVQQ